MRELCCLNFHASIKKNVIEQSLHYYNEVVCEPCYCKASICETTGHNLNYNYYANSDLCLVSKLYISEMHASSLLAITCTWSIDKDIIIIQEAYMTDHFYNVCGVLQANLAHPCFECDHHFIVIKKNSLQEVSCKRQR